MITGSRAEYGILEPLLAKISGSSRLDLKLLVTGMHLLKRYGSTVREISERKFEPVAKIPMFRGHPSDIGYFGRSLARAIAGMTNAFAQIRPDVVVVFGDRLEQLAATLAAATLRIPTVHLESGDKTDSGHIDEPTRHAITRFASLHLTATSKSKRRVIRMGEERWRVHRVGALGLDSILSCPPMTKNAIAKELSLDPTKPFIVCVFHPVHLEKERAGQHMREILGAVRQLKMPTVIIYPNNDPGSEEIIAEIDKCRKQALIRVVANLDHMKYVNLLRYASVLLGNSSSGIIEAPSLGIPVVNVGSRNTGREHARNVVFVPANTRAIVAAVKRVLTNKSFRRRMRRSGNPYGNGTASERITRILTDMRVDDRLLRKRVTF